MMTGLIKIAATTLIIVLLTSCVSKKRAAVERAAKPVNYQINTEQSGVSCIFFGESPGIGRVANLQTGLLKVAPGILEGGRVGAIICNAKEGGELSDNYYPLTIRVNNSSYNGLVGRVADAGTGVVPIDLPTINRIPEGCSKFYHTHPFKGLLPKAKGEKVDKTIAGYASSAESGTSYRTLVAGKTVLTNTRGHGYQVEYFDESGSSHLWYPGNRAVVPSNWKIEEGNVCFGFGSNTYNPVTKRRGRGFECAPIAKKIVTHRATLPGDAFNLKSGSVPYRLSRTEAPKEFDAQLSKFLKPECYQNVDKPSAY